MNYMRFCLRGDNMKCPYCGSNLNDAIFPILKNKLCYSIDYIPDGIDVLYELDYGGVYPTKREYLEWKKEDVEKAKVKYVEYELGFSCGHCGGFITSDENKAIEILSDKSDEVYQVDPEEKREMADRLLTLIRAYNLEDEVFDIIIKRNSWIEKSLKSLDNDCK